MDGAGTYDRGASSQRESSAAIRSKFSAEFADRVCARAAVPLEECHNRRTRRSSWHLALDWLCGPHHLYHLHVRAPTVASFCDQPILSPRGTLCDGRHSRCLDEESIVA